MSFIIPPPPFLLSDRRHYCHLAKSVLLLFFSLFLSRRDTVRVIKSRSALHTPIWEFLLSLKANVKKKKIYEQNLVKWLLESGTEREARKWSTKMQLFLLPPCLYLGFSADCCWYFISFKHHSICKHKHFQYFCFYRFNIRNTRPKISFSVPCKYKLV